MNKEVPISIGSPLKAADHFVSHSIEMSLKPKGSINEDSMILQVAMLTARVKKYRRLAGQYKRKAYHIIVTDGMVPRKLRGDPPGITENCDRFHKFVYGFASNYAIVKLYSRAPSDFLSRRNIRGKIKYNTKCEFMKYLVDPYKIFQIVAFLQSTINLV